jgi:pro-sigmaK processing inhibitor BofA
LGTIAAEVIILSKLLSLLPLIGGVYLALRLISVPMRFLGRLFSRVLIGVFLLLALRLVGTHFGFFVPLSLPAAAVSGILGAPGVILVCLLGNLL